MAGKSLYILQFGLFGVKEYEGLLKRLPVPILAGLLALSLGCSDGLEPVPFQGVSGTVRFSGARPDSTDWVRLAVYRDVPASTLDLFAFVAFSDTLQLSGDSTAYVLALEPGTYRWLPAIWKRRDAPLSADALRVVGWYTGSGPFDTPLSFEVDSGGETAGVDLLADFANLLTADEALEALR